MNFNDLRKEVYTDLLLDRSDLVNESIKTPKIYVKYLSEYSNSKLQLASLENEKKILFKEKWLYYNGKADASVYRENPFNLKLLKTDVTMFIDADADLLKLEEKIVIVKEKIYFISKILEEISRRTFGISNCIKMLQFENGGI